MGVPFGVSYFGTRDPRHVRHDLDEIAGAGFAAVTHTFSEYDLRYHLADMERIVEETKARGLEAALDPWGVAGLFGGEAYSELALVDLDSRQVDARGRSLPASCPNAPAARALLARWARTAVELGADVLFWDEPHFWLGGLSTDPPVSGCRCRWCAEAWQREHPGVAFPPEDDPRLAEFRIDSLRGLLREAAAAGGAVRQALCLLPRGEFARAGTDDWERLASLPGVERLATDPYWMERSVDPAAYVHTHSAPLRALCAATAREMEIWIQGIRIPAGSESRILEACEAAVAAGAQRLAFWSFRGTDRMASLACGDPEAAWAAMREAVRRFG